MKIFTLQVAVFTIIFTQNFANFQILVWVLDKNKQFKKTKQISNL